MDRERAAGIPAAASRTEGRQGSESCQRSQTRVATERSQVGGVSLGALPVMPEIPDEVAREAPPMTVNS